MAKRPKQSRRHRKQAPARPRGTGGRLLSKDAAQARDREATQRALDMAFMTPAQFAKQRKAEARAIQVKEEKEGRYERFRAKRDAYQWNPKPNISTLADAELINAGIMPHPSDVVEHGEITEYIWTWQGAHALQTAQDFLIQVLDGNPDMPSDLIGSLAMGNGHGKNSQWIGTKFGTPRQVWEHSQTFLSSQSKNTVALNQLPLNSEEAVSIWAEVKMTSQGRVIHNENKSDVGKAVGSRRKATGASRKPVHRRAGTKNVSKGIVAKNRALHASSGQKVGVKRKRKK